ncbi:unnamed protein product [Haemonchus placei]|uniref:Uncharacterized protein n=1 Tax=Haemonchus placei TaxID=6290 RepID=A0A0N4WWV6_HAEPC|nr:unnamed protein product [Haemonchus placei]
MWDGFPLRKKNSNFCRIRYCSGGTRYCRETAGIVCKQFFAMKLPRITNKIFIKFSVC